jgi:hypothetical protein
MSDMIDAYAAQFDGGTAAGDGRALSAVQREILAALAAGWGVHRWRCKDGVHRWHWGEDEVDGRSVRGLWLRGLVEIDMLRHRLPSLVIAADDDAAHAGDGRRWEGEG